VISVRENGPVSAFREHRIKYEPASRPKSDIYRDCSALIDHQKLFAQLCSLERRTSRQHG
jgi:hypothetical protein